MTLDATPSLRARVLDLLTRLDRDDAPALDLADFQTLVEQIYAVGLCDIDEDGMDPVAVQHLLAALDTLSLVKRHLTLAQLVQTRALAGR